MTRQEKQQILEEETGRRGLEFEDDRTIDRLFNEWCNSDNDEDEEDSCEREDDDYEDDDY